MWIKKCGLIFNIRTEQLFERVPNKICIFPLEKKIGIKNCTTCGVRMYETKVWNQRVNIHIIIKYAYKLYVYSKYTYKQIHMLAVHTMLSCQTVIFY